MTTDGGSSRHANDSHSMRETCLRLALYEKQILYAKIIRNHTRALFSLGITLAAFDLT